MGGGNSQTVGRNGSACVLDARILRARHLMVLIPGVGEEDMGEPRAGRGADGGCGG